MKISLDTDSQILTLHTGSAEESMPLYSKRAFELISEQWLKVGWNQKYVYTFSWLGRPIIQLPEDILRIQEVVYRVKPDVLIETGVAHGGSLIFYASLFKAMGKGRVIGIDIDIRAHNRAAIESHELASSIELIQGSSIAADTFARVHSLLKPGETVLVVLDSNHTKAHVLEELRLYSELVSVDSYIVATDGSMEYLHDVPRGKREWLTDNPKAAAEQFASENPDFVLESPNFPFNESELTAVISHWPSAYLRRTGART